MKRHENKTKNGYYLHRVLWILLAQSSVDTTCTEFCGYYLHRVLRLLLAQSSVDTTCAEFCGYYLHRVLWLLLAQSSVDTTWSKNKKMRTWSFSRESQKNLFPTLFDKKTSILKVDLNVSAFYNMIKFLFLHKARKLNLFRESWFKVWQVFRNSL